MFNQIKGANVTVQLDVKTMTGVDSLLLCAYRGEGQREDMSIEVSRLVKN